MQAQLKILILDDEKNARELIVQLLHRYFAADFSVSEASSAKEAQQLFQHQVFDVVFSDSKMPFSDGIELIESITTKQTQVVLCTALGLADFKNTFTFPVYFLQKPIDFDHFKAICEIILLQINGFKNELII